MHNNTTATSVNGWILGKQTKTHHLSAEQHNRRDPEQHNNHLSVFCTKGRYRTTQEPHGSIPYKPERHNNHLSKRMDRGKQTKLGHLSVEQHNRGDPEQHNNHISAKQNNNHISPFSAKGRYRTTQQPHQCKETQQLSQCIMYERQI